MRVIALRTLRAFWEQHPDAEPALQAWYHDVKQADVAHACGHQERLPQRQLRGKQSRGFQRERQRL